MSSIPGIRFDITGASGSQGLLTPKSGWRAYVLPRGGYVSQDSSSTTFTFDSAAIAGRFAAGIWIQAGLSAANIRQVASVGGNSLIVSGAAVTVTENTRIYIIGSTEPTISGGSVTYSTPATTILQRDDDGSDRYTNSMVTSTSDGLIQFFSTPAVYDCLIQDGNQALQGSLIDVPVGVAEGVSTSQASVFGATVTFNANVGITGSLVLSGTLLVGQTTTLNGALGVTGTAKFGVTVTMNANVGVTGTLTVGTLIGSTVTVNGLLGVTGVATFGSTISATTIIGTSDFRARRFSADQGSTMTSARWSLTAGWGSTAAVTVSNGSVDQAGQVFIVSNGATFASNPSVTLTFINGGWGGGRHGVATLTRLAPDYACIPLERSGANATTITWIAGVTASANQTYALQYIFFGTTGGF